MRIQILVSGLIPSRSWPYGAQGVSGPMALTLPPSVIGAPSNPAWSARDSAFGNVIWDRDPAAISCRCSALDALGATGPAAGHYTTDMVRAGQGQLQGVGQRLRIPARLSLRLRAGVTPKFVLLAVGHIQGFVGVHVYLLLAQIDVSAGVVGGLRGRGMSLLR